MNTHVSDARGSGHAGGLVCAVGVVVAGLGVLFLAAGSAQGAKANWPNPR